MATRFLYWFLALFLFLNLGPKAGTATLQPRAPNFQYFERIENDRSGEAFDIANPKPRTQIPTNVKENFKGRFPSHVTVITADDNLGSKQQPKYRYPYYDLNGKGKLLYGYGGTDLYQYKAYSPLEGIH